jgi:hypothetical protein
VGDQIAPGSGDFVIGIDANPPGDNLFRGLLDWLTVETISLQRQGLDLFEWPALSVYLPVIMAAPELQVED